MVRNYVRKTNRATSYSKEDLKKATNDVKAGVITLYRASKMYNIPRDTLRDHVKGRRGMKSDTLGRSTAIPLHLENSLANGIRCMEKWGFGLSRREVLTLVGDFIRRNELSTPFSNGVPGKDWFINFKKRHNLSLKKPQSVEYARRKSTDPFIISSYFDLLNTTLTDLGLKSKPQQVWNLDETSFCVDPSQTKVVGQKGLPSSRTTSGPGRENTTVLFACNALGGKAPPLVVFKGKNIWDQWMASEGTGFPQTSYAATPNGWMDTETFRNYFEKSFLKHVGDQRPLLLVYDGHASHIDERVIELAVKENITILKLPPHSSHLLQPLDLSVFRSMKSSWDRKLVEWQRKHQGSKIPKKIFSELVGEIWQGVTSEVICNGFKKGGIYPFNDKVIPRERFDPVALHRWDADKNATQESDSPSTSSHQDTIQSGTDDASKGPLTEHPPTAQSSVSFEKLLLATMNDNKTVGQKNPRKRVAAGSEIITTNEVLIRLRTKKNKSGAKETGKEINQRKGPILSDETDSDAEKNLCDDESDYDELFEEELKDMEETHFSRDVSEHKVGDWVVVKYVGKKSAKHFVGQIIDINSVTRDPIVKFTRRVPSAASATTFVWAEPEDTSDVSQEDIELFLQEPTLGRRGELRFNISFAGYNVQ